MIIQTQIGKNFFLGSFVFVMIVNSFYLLGLSSSNIYFCTTKYKYILFVLNGTSNFYINMPKIEQFDKNVALDKAMNLFWHQGYKGTSLNDLTNELDIGKGSFYNTFKSKRELFEQCISIYMEFSTGSIQAILETEKDVKKGLYNFLIFNLEYAANDPKHRGCFLTNICTELASSDEMIAQLMTEHYKAMKSIMTDYLARGSDLKKEAIEGITNTIITFFIGMTVEVKLQKSKKEIEQSINLLIQSLL